MEGQSESRNSQIGRSLPTPVMDGNRGLEVRPEGTETLTSLNMNFLFFFESG